MFDSWLPNQLLVVYQVLSNAMETEISDEGDGRSDTLDLEDPQIMNGVNDVAVVDDEDISILGENAKDEESNNDSFDLSQIDNPSEDEGESSSTNGPKSGKEGAKESLLQQQERQNKERQKTKEEMAEADEDYYFKHEWPKHEKHIFILSSAGKPVYSR